jgi:hypothetical protein
VDRPRGVDGATPSTEARSTMGACGTSKSRPRRGHLQRAPAGCAGAKHAASARPPPTTGTRRVLSWRAPLRRRRLRVATTQTVGRGDSWTVPAASTERRPPPKPDLQWAPAAPQNRGLGEATSYNGHPQGVLARNTRPRRGHLQRAPAGCAGAKHAASARPPPTTGTRRVLSWRAPLRRRRLRVASTQTVGRSDSWTVPAASTERRPPAKRNRGFFRLTVFPTASIHCVDASDRLGPTPQCGPDRSGEGQLRTHRGAVGRGTTRPRTVRPPSPRAPASRQGPDVASIAVTKDARRRRPCRHPPPRAGCPFAPG